MHTISKFLAGLAVAGGLLHAGETQLLTEAVLSQLRSEATRTHPSAIAGKHQAIAAAHEARSVRLWNDPMVGIGFMGATEMMRMDDGDIMVGFEQALPKPGMFAAERSKMEAMQRAQIENSGSFALNAGAEVAKAAIELALSDESIALQQAQIQWMTKMVENAKQMAADPMGSSTDALRMETELAKEQQMLDAARRSREGFAMNLNLILGRPLDSPWPVLKLPASAPPVPIAQAEIARIPHANPKVRAMREMATAAKADTRIADRERQPEVAVGVDAQLYSDTGDIKSTTLCAELSKALLIRWPEVQRPHPPLHPAEDRRAPTSRLAWWRRSRAASARMKSPPKTASCAALCKPTSRTAISAVSSRRSRRNSRLSTGKA